jgi:hypothetical protein
MYNFYATLHARPASATAGPAIELAGRRLSTLAIAPAELSGTTLATSFEAARTRLDALARMYSEPDGSFVWVSSQGEPAWQVDGNLYDRQQQLQFVDLKGTCPAESFDRLLKALVGPTASPMFQLTREAVFLDDAEFRKYAERD